VRLLPGAGMTHPMSANLAKILTDSAERDPGATALRLDDAALSYAMLDEASARVAGLLAGSGVGPGDRVGLMLPNVPYFAAAYYGILRLGAVVVPMNVLLKAREVGFYLADPAARLVFAWHDFAGAAQAGATEAGAELVLVAPGEFEQLLAAAEPRAEVAERAADDTAVILYTSGTTGKPKGAELTHDNLRRNADAARGLFDLGVGDVALGALPLFHSFGQTCGLNATISGGGCLTLIPRFDPGKALEIIQRDRVGIFEGVPTMYSAMLHHPDAGAYDTSSLRVCVSGGSAMPVEVLRAFEERFGCKVLEGYGLSETSPVASFNHPDRERKPGSIGTPIEGVEMKAVDEDGAEVPGGEVGEIVIRGHNVMKGYWERPEATAEAIRDGWLSTGDMARVDEDGYFFIVDRKKDLIIRGGYNVYPREVEEVLYEHPAVREAAVVGMPDDDLGEEVGAAVALKEGREAGADELQAFVREHVAAYKYPRRIWFVDELPKGPTGKILKREIEPPA
jgi:long-chain acyl-CoA synthetase